MPVSSAFWATPMARAAVWIRADSKVAINWKPLAFLSTQQVLGSDLEVIEAQFVLLHAAIAQHLDLATAHALGEEQVAVLAARLFGAKNMERPR